MTSYPSAPPPGGERPGENDDGAPGSYGQSSSGGYGQSPPGSYSSGSYGQGSHGQGAQGGTGQGAGSYGQTPSPSYGQGSYGPQSQGGQTPVCPRHPDRPSYVRCQRCNQPTCPECQRVAPVGIHCVNCARAEERSMPAERSQLGGRQRSRPTVTITIMAICVLLYLSEWVIGRPATWENLVFWPGVGAQEPWRMITTAFLHGGIIHLAFNMYALWITGSFLERALGTWRFIALYLVSAIGGTVAVVLLTPLSSWGTMTVGASGAVFGLFAATGLLLYRGRGDYRQLLVVIAINMVISFTLPFISWQAHLGGLITGALVALLYVYLPKKQRTRGAIIGLVALTVLLLGAAFLRYSAAGFL